MVRSLSGCFVDNVHDSIQYRNQCAPYLKVDLVTILVHKKCNLESILEWPIVCNQSHQLLYGKWVCFHEFQDDNVKRCPFPLCPLCKGGFETPLKRDCQQYWLNNGYHCLHLLLLLCWHHSTRVFRNPTDKSLAFLVLFKADVAW